MITKWLTSKIRKIFIAGLLVTLPITITIFFTLFLFNSVDNILGPALTRFLIYFGFPIHPTYRIPGLGFIGTLVIVFFAGLMVTNLLGKKLIHFGERLLKKIPVVRSIYSAVKQVIDAVASTTNAGAFQKVVLFEFPRKGIYSIGLISSESFGEAQEKTKREVVNVFIPTVPNITTGFFLMIPKEDLITLSMSIEDGIKMIISGGILVPSSPYTGTSSSDLPDLKQ